MPATKNKHGRKKDFFAVSYTKVTKSGKKKQVVFDYENDHKKALNSASTRRSTRITDILGNAVLFSGSGNQFAQRYTGRDNAPHTRHYPD